MLLRWILIKSTINLSIICDKFPSKKNSKPWNFNLRLIMEGHRSQFILFILFYKDIIETIWPYRFRLLLLFFIHWPLASSSSKWIIEKRNYLSVTIFKPVVYIVSFGMHFLVYMCNIEINFIQSRDKAIKNLAINAIPS